MIPDCLLRVTTDGHTQYSSHALCVSQAGCDPFACVLCEMRFWECRSASSKANSKLPTLENLRRAWQRVRKLNTVGGLPAVWADPSRSTPHPLSLSLVLGL